MKISVQVAFDSTTPPDFIAATGRLVEEYDIHSIWAPEHVLFFERYAAHYPSFGDPSVSAATTGLIDPFVALTYLAAHTSRVRLGTGVCLVPQRHPVYTAKQVADLDYLSNGRFDFGVGVGWLKAEFEAIEMPWKRRGARTSDALSLMKSLWCDEVSNYRGEFYELPGSLMNPKPIQAPHPPIYVGGDSAPALKRVAEFGQGWYGFNLKRDAFDETLGRLDTQLARVGRKRADIEIVLSPYGLRCDRDEALRLRESGVDQLVVALAAGNIDKMKASVEAVAELRSLD